MKYVSLAAVGFLALVLTINLLSPGRPGAQGAPPPQAPDAAAAEALAGAKAPTDPPKKAAGCPCDCGCSEGLPCTCATGKKRTSLDYRAGYHAAVDQGKPLVVWVGGFRCPSCESGCTDLVHCYADSFQGDDSPRCLVSKPDGSGGLDRCGTLTVASCEAIRSTLARRTTATAGGCPDGSCGYAGQCGVGGCQAGAGCASCGSAGSFAPAFGYGGPVMMMGGGQGGGCGAGGCASGNCGGGGGGRGRRR
ncbi:MAG: hypothetical protein V4597_11725 [Pseudomonadota bacterium]